MKRVLAMLTLVAASACLTEFQFTDRDGGERDGGEQDGGERDGGASDCESCASPFPWCVDGRCVECRAAADCPAGPCDTTTGRCLLACSRRDDRCDRSLYPRGCREDEQGVARCVACEEDEHCDGGLCEVSRGVCVACRLDTDCPSGRCNRTTGSCQ